MLQEFSEFNKKFKCYKKHSTTQTHYVITRSRNFINFCKNFSLWQERVVWEINKERKETIFGYCMRGILQRLAVPRLERCRHLAVSAKPPEWRPVNRLTTRLSSSQPASSSGLGALVLGHKVLIYLEYNCVSPLVGIGPPQSISRKRVCTPPPPPEPTGEWVGEFQFWRLKKSYAKLCPFCSCTQYYSFPQGTE